MSYLHLSSGPSTEVQPAQANVFPWFGIRTRSNQEKTAASILAGKGYDPFLPLHTKLRQRPDRVIVTKTPLFPGYFFCRFDPRERLPIVSTAGVVSVLGFGNELAAIPDHEIEAVQAILRSGVPVQPHAFIQEGQRIRITRGSFEGLEGILVRAKSEVRLVVSIHMLQRSISVEIDHDFITLA